MSSSVNKHLTDPNPGNPSGEILPRIILFHNCGGGGYNTVHILQSWRSASKVNFKDSYLPSSKPRTKSTFDFSSKRSLFHRSQLWERLWQLWTFGWRDGGRGRQHFASCQSPIACLRWKCDTQGRRSVGDLYTLFILLFIAQIRSGHI